MSTSLFWATDCVVPVLFFACILSRDNAAMVALPTEVVIR